MTEHRQLLNDLVKRCLIRELESHGYNMWHTAIALGVSRRALYRLMAKHKLPLATSTQFPTFDFKGAAWKSPISTSKGFMTTVTIRSIANGWIVVTPYVEYFYDNIEQAGRAAEGAAKLSPPEPLLQLIEASARAVSAPANGSKNV